MAAPSHSPLRSMTGYGSARAPVAGGSVLVEVKSVNHRYLDVGVKGPREYASLEPRIIELVRRRVRRGKLDVLVNRSVEASAAGAVRVDLELARAYQAALSTLSRTLGLPGEVTLEMVATQRDVLALASQGDAASEAAAIEQALTEALDALSRMREQEGARLGEDLGQQLSLLGELVRGAEARAPAAVEEYRVRLADRLQRLLGETQLDPARFAQEAALLAERTDVHEELVRLKSHLSQLQKLLAEGGDLGRKLDFLLQEIGREVNTLGSKANDVTLSGKVMEMKAVAERIREQVQNVE